MQIDINSIDKDSFQIKEGLIAGEVCYLVQPNHIGTKFTQQNKIFRSSIWSKGGELASASFCKFVNLGENPDNFPPPKSLKNTNILEKLDGSTLILSKFRGELICRTRGSFHTLTLENHFELDILKNKYPLFFGFFDDVETGDVSLLAEWESPINQIVIKHAEVDIKLIGCIKHEDYSLYTQKELDVLAKDLQIGRPKYFNFKDLDEVIKCVEQFQNCEGVCIYSNNDNEIHKCKSLQYLTLHRFKEKANLETVVDLFCEYDYPTYQELEQKLINNFDHECFSLVRGFCSQVCDAKKEVDKIIISMQNFIDERKNWPRKDLAKDVISSYGPTNRSAFLFTLVDKKKLEKDNIKKLLYQCLKN